jgi:hypothetical protein
MLPFAVILLSSGRDDCISAVGLMLAVPSDAYVVQGQGIQNRTLTMLFLFFTLVAVNIIRLLHLAVREA